MKEHGIVDSGDALQLGIGAMTDARWKAIFDTMVDAGIYKPSLEYSSGYTTQFVNKKVGFAKMLCQGTDKNRMRGK